MSGNSSRASNQSTPSCLVSNPNDRARAKPSLAGSIPIIQRGSNHSERNNLYNRSVLMFPDPTIATVALSAIERLLFEIQSYRTQSGKLCDEVAARGRVDRA